jgi:hypothetical protein
MKIIHPIPAQRKEPQNVTANAKKMTPTDSSQLKNYKIDRQYAF